MSPDDDLKPFLDSFRWRNRPAPVKAVVRIVEAADRWAFIVILLLVASVLWMPPAFRATGLEISAPIDDIWIHAQYARNLVRGHISVWTPHDGYSLGATSALYPVVLAMGWLAGFRGSAIMIFALLVNLLGMAAFLRAAMQLVWRGGALRVAWLTPPLLLLNGPLLWSVYSGMEVGFSAGLLGGFLVALHRDFHRPLPHGPRMATLLLAALVPLARPDWLLLSFPMLVFVCVFNRRRWRLAGFGLSCLSLLPLFLWFLANFIATGFWLPNSQLLKSLAHDSHFMPGERMGQFLGNLAFTLPHHLRAVYGGAHLLLLALLPGLLVLWHTPPVLLRRFRFDLALVLSVALHYVQLSTLTLPEAYHFRYLAVDFALLAIVVLRLAAFAVRIAPRVLPPMAPHLSIGFPLVTVLLALGSVYNIPAVHAAYLQKWTYFHDNQIALGKLLASRRRSMPELNGPILLGEAGAIPYFCESRYLDMMGLCSQAADPIAPYYTLSPMATFEAIERMSRDRWPFASIVFNAMGHPPFAGKSLIHRESPIPGDPMQLTPWWLSVYRFPREYLASGHRPPASAIPSGWQVADALDFVDVADEALHNFRIHKFPTAEHQAITFAVFDDPTTPAADCGRMLDMPMTWTIDASRPTILLFRLESTDPRAADSLPVHLPGSAAPAIECMPLRGAPSLWTSREPLPAGTSATTLRLEPAPWLSIHHLWIIQPISKNP